MYFSKKQFKVLKRSKKKIKINPVLRGCPQKSGICERLFLADPKKPNSANRRVARVKLSTFKMVTVAIPGEFTQVKPNAEILIRGGRVRDLPGVNYKAIPGTRDFQGITDRRQGRSKYGAKRVVN